MKDLTIYNVYVEMTSQEQCNRMKQLCVDNELPIWKNKSGWKFFDWVIYSFSYDYQDSEFFCFNIKSIKNKNKTKVTEEQFIELLKK